MQALPAAQIGQRGQSVVEVKDRSELRIRSMVDLRVVDLLVVDFQA